MFDEDAEKALHAAQDRPMEHDRGVLGIVFADVAGTEALGKIGIDLDGSELPAAAERVGNIELELGAVERAFAGIDNVTQSHGLARLGQRLLGAIPELVGAEALFGASRELGDN